MHFILQLQYLLGVTAFGFTSC